MGGKALLIVIYGFSLTLLILGNYYNRLTSSSNDNLVEYSYRQISHNIAITGANIGCNALFLEPTWTTGFNNVAFQNGTVNVSVVIADADNNIRKLVSISSLSGYDQGKKTIFHDTVIVTFQPSRFSKFAYYSSSEGGTIYWATGDTVKGPMHTQDYLRVSGKPVFKGKVTTKLGLKKKTSSDKPVFELGYSIANLPINSSASTNLETYAGAGGKKFTGNDTVYLTFKGDSLQVKYKWNGPTTTSLTNALAPNGVIFVKNGTIRLKGTVSGQYTVGCSNDTKGGSVYLDDNIVYSSNPLTNPTSTDLLGIVAENNVWVTDNATNNSGGININASIYCQTGSFGAENYSGRVYAGYINLVGGIIQAIRGAVGVIGSSGKITNGFSKNYSYDTRFMFSAPPSYPNTGSYEIISWYE